LISSGDDEAVASMLEDMAHDDEHYNGAYKSRHQKDLEYFRRSMRPDVAEGRRKLAATIDLHGQGTREAASSRGRPPLDDLFRLYEKQSKATKQAHAVASKEQKIDQAVEASKGTESGTFMEAAAPMAKAALKQVAILGANASIPNIVQVANAGADATVSAIDFLKSYFSPGETPEGVAKRADRLPPELWSEASAKRNSRMFLLRRARELGIPFRGKTNE